MADDGLSAGAAARQLGVAVTTLRTWHQRYGLGPSRHEPGHHRRYTAEDMQRLHVMQRLTAQGVAPAEAAAWARRSAAEVAAPAEGDSGSPSADPPLPPPGDPSPGSSSAPAGGGQTIALGHRADPAARGLARAAMRLDAPAMRQIVEDAIANRGVIPTWTHVIMPVLIGIGERYEATKRFIEVEHLLSRTVTEALAGVRRPPPEHVPRVLLAAADEDQHTLPLEALAAALAEKGVPTRLFGARVPAQALLDAVSRTGPAVVVLWSQLPSSGDVGQLVRLSRVPHPPLLIAAAGPGWPATELPPDVLLLGSLTDAVRIVSAA